MKYAEIVFCQGNDLPDDFFNLSIKEMKDYLAQWDYGDNDNIVDDYKTVIGSSDRVHETKNYILSYNYHLDYASLFRKIED